MTHWDERMRASTIGLNFFEIRMCLDGWFKLYFYGGSRRNLGQESIWCCIHNDEAIEVTNLSKYIGEATNN